MNPDFSKPSRPISQDDVQTYAEQGVVCLRGVFDLSWIEALRAGFEQAMLQPGPHAEDYTPAGQPGRFFADLDIWQRQQTFREFVLQSPAAEIAGRVMGSSQSTFLYDQMFYKAQGTQERTPWHQDQPYWAVSGRQVCSLWLPLDPVRREAALSYVAGSHLWQEHNPHHFSDDSPYRDTGLPELPDIDANSGDYDILGWDLEPGDCLVFQAMIVHGSAGNLESAHPRRALATRWLGDDARYLERPGEVAIPTTDPQLKNGDCYGGSLHPRVWST